MRLRAHDGGRNDSDEYDAGNDACGDAAADELLAAAIGLVRSNNALRVPARLVGMTACDLVGEDEGFQLSFDFDQTHADSMEQLGSRVDGLRDKYGKQIIRRASQLNSEQKESKDKK